LISERSVSNLVGRSRWAATRPKWRTLRALAADAESRLSSMRAKIVHLGASSLLTKSLDNCRMSAGDSICYRTSRAKTLPLAIVLPMLMTILALPTLAATTVAIGEPSPSVACAAVLLLFLFFGVLWLEIKFVRRVIHPDTLTLTKQGFRITRLGKVSAYDWSNLGEPYSRWISVGRSASQVVALPYLTSDHTDFLIPADQYEVSVEAILSAMLSARSGTMPKRVEPKVPALFAYVVVPALGIATASFIGVFGFAFVEMLRR
jgi:hypothetical protein